MGDSILVEVELWAKRCVSVLRDSSGCIDESVWQSAGNRSCVAAEVDRHFMDSDQERLTYLELKGQYGREFLDHQPACCALTLAQFHNMSTPSSLLNRIERMRRT